MLKIEKGLGRKHIEKKLMKVHKNLEKNDLEI